MKTRTPTTGAKVSRPPRRPRAQLAGLALAGLVAVSTVASCSEDDPNETATSTTSTSAEPTTPSATSEPTQDATTPVPPDDTSTTGAPPFPADTSSDTADPSQDAMLTVTDVRIGRHEGFDRVVYEMGGTGTPGWTVQYVDEAVQDGSGTVIDLAGDGTLQVLISGSAYPMDSGAEPFESAGPVTGPGTVTVTEARGWSVFEGITDAFIGLQSSGHPFRVYLLESPVRVVVDIADATTP